MAELHVVRAPFIDFETCLDWQNQLVAARQQDLIPDVLLAVTHPPVYTAGKHANLETNLLGTRPDIPVVPIDRGGDLTYHGPGQVVAYPIMKKGRRGVAKAHVEAMEEAVIRVCADLGVTAFRRPDYPGVWVDTQAQYPAKICAVGVRITDGVTKHGLAFNVAVNLDDYAGIIPCGIVEGTVTSLDALGVSIHLEIAREMIIDTLGETLDGYLIAGHLDDLLAAGQGL